MWLLLMPDVIRLIILPYQAYHELNRLKKRNWVNLLKHLWDSCDQYAFSRQASLLNYSIIKLEINMNETPIGHDMDMAQLLLLSFAPAAVGMHRVCASGRKRSLCSDDEWQSAPRKRKLIQLVDHKKNRKFGRPLSDSTAFELVVSHACHTVGAIVNEF